MAMIDLDGVEYCYKCRRPLLLVEVARDTEQPEKSTRVLVELAKLSGVDAIVALYTPGSGETDITQFRVKRVYPELDEQWTIMPPQRFASMLWDVHDLHQKTCNGSRSTP